PLAFALLAFAATACAGEPGTDTADTADTPPAADAAEPPLEARMAVEPPPRRMPGSDEAVEQCDADAARGVIGQAATAEVVEQARQAAGAELVRTLSPGQMVTMEYHFSRLNLDVDEANVITGVRCG